MDDVLEKAIAQATDYINRKILTYPEEREKRMQSYANILSFGIRQGIFSQSPRPEGQGLRTMVVSSG